MSNLGAEEALSRIERGMRSVGYSNQLIKRDYEYADFVHPSLEVRTIPLAAFAQYPPDYRNACIGVVVGDGDRGKTNVEGHCFLGAPLMFEVSRSGVSEWKIAGGREAVFLRSMPFQRVETEFQENARRWGPESIFRAKGVVLAGGPYQLDFVDAGNMSFLEGIIHKKLDSLLQDTVREAVRVLKKKEGSGKVDWEYLFKLLFRFVAAKVFRDRREQGGWLSDDADEALSSIEAHYRDREYSRSRERDRDLKSGLWDCLRRSFHFQNLSVEDLAYIYENTFIRPETRKTFGVHSTPSEVAEYLVRKLPFGDLSESTRRVLEPCAGHGVFLVSAMRRLRELLPLSTSRGDVHGYLQERLVAIEIDPFAREVNRLSLMLADYPNPDGWHIYQGDVFSGSRLREELKRADVVLCNPPFEDFTSDERERYGGIAGVHKPAELLGQVLDSPPRLLGFVLPHIFTSGRAYKLLHRRLAGIYKDVVIVSLPESIFRHSDVGAVLLLSWGRAKRVQKTSVSCANVAKDDVGSFLRDDRQARWRKRVVTLPVAESESLVLWTPQLWGAWEYLRGYPILGDFVEIRRGIHWLSDGRLRRRGYSRSDLRSPVARKGFRLGHRVSGGNLQQFRLRNKPVYLSLIPEVQHDGGYLYEWHKPKVVCNRARFGRGDPWRLAAALDPHGMAFSEQFLAIWSGPEVSPKLVLSLLNSPVANAYLFAQEEGRDNRTATLKGLPIPSVSSLRGERVEETAAELLTVIEKAGTGEGWAEDRAKEVLLRLDAAILKAYNLPPVLERELLDLFQGFPRPVPFEFKGYYPPGFEAYLPLHELISEGFQNSVAKRVLSIEPIKDEKISAMLELLMEDAL